MNEAVDLSVIIVTWNSQDWIVRCLQSIYAQTTDVSLEVIVVDNASKDRTVQFVMNQFLQAQVIRHDTNLGFAAAVNSGMAAASGRYICVLNPDTEVKDRALERLLAAMDADPSIGIAAPQLLNTDGSVQASLRRFPTWRDQSLILLKLHALWPDARSLYRYFARDLDYRQAQDVEQVMGACMLIRRELVDAIGRFDQKFFIWFEEVDFCYRTLKHAHYRIVYLPSMQVVHAGGSSFDKVAVGTKQRWYRRSVRYFMRKHKFWGSWLLLWAITPLSFLSGLLVALVSKTKRGKATADRAKEQRKKA